MNIIELSNTLSTYFVNYEKIFCYYLKQLKTVQVQYRSSVSCAKWPFLTLREKKSVD
jgi:hypothetical protein